MFRFILILLATVLLITFLRSVVGLILRAFAEMIGGAPAQSAGGAGRTSVRPPSVPTGGELKRDPVCGTYIGEAASVKKTVRGEVVHFCSAACRDKYAG
jgi:YHS domain-containing protein